MKYVGKICALGTYGSGKTKFLKLLTNLANKRIIEIYKEEFEGTLKTKPYSIPFSKEKILIVDNPGQNSLESLRTIVAQTGEPYKGILLFLDSINKNSWLSGLKQCDVIRKATKNPSIPILVIGTKFDLHKLLLGSREIVDDLAKLIVKIITQKQLQAQKKLPFYNKRLSEVEYISFDFEKASTIPFTQLEQILVNGVEEYLNLNPISGFTSINIRVFIRSLLLGFCNLFKRYSMLPDFKRQYPDVIIPDKIMDTLFYFRPTAFELKTSWSKMSNNEKEEEPLIPLQYFNYASVASMIKNEVVLLSENELADFILEHKPDYNIKSLLPCNTKKRTSLEAVLNVLSTFVLSDEFKDNPKKLQSTSATEKQGLLGLKTKFSPKKPPPKPKFNNFNSTSGGKK